MIIHWLLAALKGFGLLAGVVFIGVVFGFGARWIEKKFPAKGILVTTIAIILGIGLFYTYQLGK